MHVSKKVLRRAGTLCAMPAKHTRAIPRQTLARNLRFLMKREQLSEEALEKRSGVAQKTINNILNEASAATLDTLDKIAGAFGLTAWHLIMPNLPDELISSPSMEKLYRSYVSASKEGRALIEHVAEREGKYKK